MPSKKKWLKGLTCAMCCERKADTDEHAVPLRVGKVLKEAGLGPFKDSRFPNAKASKGIPRISTAVCDPCNQWMGERFEHRKLPHSKKVDSLVLGKSCTLSSTTEFEYLAAWCFKTALMLDRAVHNKQKPQVSNDNRWSDQRRMMFRDTGEVPDDVSVFIAMARRSDDDSTKGDAAADVETYTVPFLRTKYALDYFRIECLVVYVLEAHRLFDINQFIQNTLKNEPRLFHVSPTATSLAWPLETVLTNKGAKRLRKQFSMDLGADNILAPVQGGGVTIIEGDSAIGSS